MTRAIHPARPPVSPTTPPPALPPSLPKQNMSTLAGPTPDLNIRFDETVPILEIPTEMSFEELRDWLRQTLPEQEDMVGGRTSRLDLGARAIKLFDLRRLIHFLREEFAIDVTGIYVLPQAIHTYAERELKLKLFPIVHIVGDTVEVSAGQEDVEGEPTEAPDADDLADELLDPPDAIRIANVTLPNDLKEEDLDAAAAALPDETHRNQGRRTLTLYRTLRSGAVVRFDGDLFIFGDVNPGAQIIATGNVTVLGGLRGMVHAGAAGEETACIFSLNLRPTQLRIGRKIAVAPDRSAASPLPEMASVIGEQIVIEPFQGKLRNH